MHSGNLLLNRQAPAPKYPQFLEPVANFINSDWGSIIIRPKIYLNSLAERFVAVPIPLSNNNNISGNIPLSQGDAEIIMKELHQGVSNYFSLVTHQLGTLNTDYVAEIYNLNSILEQVKQIIFDIENSLLDLSLYGTTVGIDHMLFIS